MAETMLKAQASGADAGTSKVPPTPTPIPSPTPTVNPSQDEGSAIELSSAPTFSLDDEDIQEVNKPNPSDDDLMMFEEEEESSGSQHSTSKPKEKKKKKKNVVIRKEFMSLQAKVIDETHTTYESTISILQATINRLQKSLTSNLHGPEILQLTKEIHKLLFNSSTPNNSQLAEAIKAQFQEVCAKSPPIITEKIPTLQPSPPPSQHTPSPHTSPPKDTPKKP
ncbi:uncharacterized protein LOC111887702 [Lactuca sativa]|uniref:uncharacterized protein LOC111887702 n=1 Tax=Lactuca sativa TaxID=4236 RepID=UPI000CD83232|nr:uncharacterized protein LOC111887702 [Lactuca sativa]